MARLPLISGRAAIKAFLKTGYYIARQRGSHVRLLHPIKKPLTVPDHKVLGKGLLRKLLRDAEMSSDSFTKLLRG